MSNDSPHETSLMILNGQVQLPTATPISPGSADMEGLLKDALPAAVAGPVIAGLRADRQRLSHCDRLWILLGLIIAGVAVWLLWPAPFHVTTQESAGPSQVGNASFRVASENRDLFGKAEKLYENERFKECVVLLDEAMPAIMSTREGFLANRRIVFLYLHACYKANDTRQSCVEHIRRAQEYDPDDMTWATGAIKLEWMPFEKHYDNYARLVAGQQGNAKEKVAVCLRKFSLLRTRMEKLLADNARHVDYKMNDEQLRDMQLIHCQLLTAMWLIQGHARHYPDDRGDPGVAEREEAYRLALAHGDDLQFLCLRRSIVRLINEHLSWYNGNFFFNGAEYFKRDILARELEEIELKLASVPQGEKPL